MGKNGVGMGMKQGWKPGGDGIKFRNNVKRVIDEQIRETDPALAAQLQKAILFGNAPRYIPEDGLVWETMPVKNN